MPQVKYLGPPEFEVAEDGYYVLQEKHVVAGPFEDEFDVQLWLKTQRRTRRQGATAQRSAE